MKFRAVLFDLDGVLIDSKNVWFELMNSAAIHFGSPPVTQEMMKTLWGSGVTEDTELLYPGQTVESVAAYYNAHFLDFVDHITVDPDAEQVMLALRQAGLGFAVTTNTPHEAAQKILTAVNLSPEIIVGGTDVPNPKPAPDMLHKALEQLTVSAENAIMVGDTKYDREAAHAAGVFFAGYGIEGDITLEKLSDLLHHLN